ncbi:MAG: SDR family oxidoreductase [Myxococcales bacterium]|nr:SDR family oxidoreductase [Myxococcales bacterium]
MTDGRTILLTGFPTCFLATRVLGRILERDPSAELRCLVQGRFAKPAQRTIEALPAASRERIVLLEGDAAAMDLGLSGPEYVDLAARVEEVHHCAAISYLGAERSQAEQTNIGGAEEVLELAEAAAGLRQIVHWSSAQVSGARRGFVLEEELNAKAGFHNHIEESRYRAEKILREALPAAPITILRPTTIVGDSVCGEIDRLEGPYLLILLMLNSPVDFRMPVPGRGDVPLNLVPIDYVVDAGLHIASDPRSIGRTFHIVDPDPLTARRVFELLANAAGRPSPRGSLPTHLAAALLRAPGLDRLSHVPRGFLEQLATEVVYDDRNARELLASSDLRCPPFESYMETMVRFVQAQQADRRAKEVERSLREQAPL